MSLNKHEKKIRQKLKDDFQHYSKTCLRIRTKEGKITPFEMSSVQLYIHKKLENQLKKTGRVRAIILKGRQQGCSTYVAGRFFWKIIHSKGMRAFILTHLEDATRNLFNIVQRFYQNSPYVIKPEIGQSNAKELTFRLLDSGYRIGTARSSGVGRSDTVQYFHGSEVAYWVNADSHISGVLQSIPDAKDTEIILESTSDGPQGVFYRMCCHARDNIGDYQLIFIPWFWQKEYSRNLEDEFTLTSEEELYKSRYNLTEGQIKWRRNKISELGNILSFRREYPSDFTEAFHSDVPDALWQRSDIEKNKINLKNAPEMRRVVIAVDPATTSGKNSDETGIIVAGLGVDGHGYVMADHSGKYTPAEWASHVVDLFYKYKVDRVVAEVNQGGDMVEHTLKTQDETIPYKSVYASRGKRTRAEPIAALDEQGKIHHVGDLLVLEDQMCAFDMYKGTKSPDRVDARVWALTELMLSRKSSTTPFIWRG